MFKQLWTESGWAKRIILIMLPLNLISQFLPYNTRGGSGLLFVDADFNSDLFFWVGDPTGIGWQLHPQAYVILACLVVIYLNEFSNGRFWTRFGFWITVPLTVLTVSPGRMADIGGGIGAICLLMSIAAAIVSIFDARRVREPAAAK